MFFLVFSRPVRLLHAAIAGFCLLLEKGKPQCASTFQASDCITFFSVRLAKASHVVNPGAKVREINYTLEREEKNFDSLQSTIASSTWISVT